MVIGIIGEICTGKTAIADELSKKMGAKVYTGKDYKNAESEAGGGEKFINMLKDYEDTEEPLICVINEKEHLSILPERTVRVLVTSELDAMKERFARQMDGRLPPQIAAMLEKNHGMFDDQEYDLRVRYVTGRAWVICDSIVNICKK